MKKLYFYLLFLLFGGHCGYLFSSAEQQMKLREERRMVFNEIKNNTDIGKKFKEAIFGAKNNVFCKPPKDGFCPSQCHYDTDVAYDYFAGRSLSSISSLSFNNTHELNTWARNQPKDTYLIAYKSGCEPCAKLLAAIGTRTQSLQAGNVSLYKINTDENQSAFYGNGFDAQEAFEAEKTWGLTGTPTVWKVNSGSVEEIKPDSYYDIFLKFRKEQIAKKEYYAPYQSGNFFNKGFGYCRHVWNDGFGCCKHDGKVVTAVVTGAIVYGTYRGYCLAKAWYLKKYASKQDDKNPIKNLKSTV